MWIAKDTYFPLEIFRRSHIVCQIKKIATEVVREKRIIYKNENRKTKKKKNSFCSYVWLHRKIYTRTKVWRMKPHTNTYFLKFPKHISFRIFNCRRNTARPSTVHSHSENAIVAAVVAREYK